MSSVPRCALHAASTGRWEIPRPLLAALLILLLSWLGGCAAPRPAGDAPGDETASVFVIARGWHTDIGLPVAALPGEFAVFTRAFPGVRMLVFGFGDRAYLLTRHHGAADALRALLPGPGAVLVTALRAPPEQAFGPDNVVALSLPRQGIDRIARFVWDALDHTGADGIRRLGDGPYPGSLYVASTSLYSGVFTCNTWTAEGLAAGGVKVIWPGVLFASQVMAQARKAEAASHP